MARLEHLYVKKVHRRQWEPDNSNQRKIIDFLAWFNRNGSALILSGKPLFNASPTGEEQRTIRLFASLCREIDDSRKLFLLLPDEPTGAIRAYINGSIYHYSPLDENGRLGVAPFSLGVENGAGAHWLGIRNFVSRARTFVFAGDKGATEPLMKEWAQVLAWLGKKAEITAARGFLLENGKVVKQ